VRVFLDTNVLASAAATRGLCSDVLREVLTSHKLLTSEQVLSELKRVLDTKFGLPRDLIDDFLWLMQQDTVLAESGPLPKVELLRIRMIYPFCRLRYRPEPTCP
jgi:predicted nucleic acid-binding protein